MPEIKRDFGNLYFKIQGDSGDAVVLLHDFFGTHEGWAAQQLFLSRYARVIAPDLRGHGRSVLKTGNLEISQMAEDTARLLDSMQIGTAHLVGCSHGAVVALHMARMMPDRVASIVVTSVPDLNDTSTIDYGKKYISDVFPRIESRLQNVHGNGQGSYVRDVLLASFQESLDNPPAAHLDAFRLAHEIACPALVLGGDIDPVMPPERAMALSRQIPDASLGILPNAGHLAHMDAPGLYTETVRDHLHRHRNR